MCPKKPWDLRLGRSAADLEALLHRGHCDPAAGKDDMFQPGPIGLKFMKRHNPVSDLDLQDLFSRTIESGFSDPLVKSDQFWLWLWDKKCWPLNSQNETFLVFDRCVFFFCCPPLNKAFSLNHFIGCTWFLIGTATAAGGCLFMEPQEHNFSM